MMPICWASSKNTLDTPTYTSISGVPKKPTHAESLELSLAYDEKLRQEKGLIDQSWRKKIQRLEYEADLARRRYEMLNPKWL